MNRIVSSLAAQSSLGYAVIRVMVGIVLVFHGYQKVFVMGFGAVIDFFGKVGIPLAQVAAPFVALLEVIGGVLLILGLFTRYLSAVFAIEFVVATYTVWILLGKGYAGSELELMILCTAVLLATNGAGRYSLDTLLKRSDA
ncbi:MAG: DoxX family protein [Candidatus Lambdaproteobacteria bacterium]|nr:DoxX family protein [Candidatus Lambdaproteobacteria bacterium]